jgi:hypothetical protein
MHSKIELNLKDGTTAGLTRDLFDTSLIHYLCCPLKILTKQEMQATFNPNNTHKEKTQNQSTHLHPFKNHY